MTEAQFLSNAEVLRNRLGPAGFDVVTLDYCWSHPDPGPVANPNQKPGFQLRLAMDGYGRLLPASERFPSAAGGVGLKAVRDRLHAMGQRFGLHLMRGIPRQAVEDGCPILGGGEGVTARDIALPDTGCTWLNHMLGVDVTKPGGQAYYDSVVALYAEWGVDYLKADDLTFREDLGYAAAEIEAIRKAIDKCGRPIVLSLSPGPAPADRATHLRANANLWRISADFWDTWPKLDTMFDLCAAWADVGVADAWPDADMIPMGPISQCGPEGPPRISRFTPDEMQTMLTLWSIFRSPLILGGDLTGYRESDWALLANPAWIEVSEHGRTPRIALEQDGLVVWAAERDASSSDGHAEADSWFLAAFNRSEGRLRRDVSLLEVLPAATAVIDTQALTPSACETEADRWRLDLPPHASAMIRVTVKPS